MIADKNFENYGNPKISVSQTQVEALIIKSMKQAVPYFKESLSANYHKKKILNEDDLTQTYVTQTQILIRHLNYPFNVNSQYRDIYNLSKGISDFHFYPNEQGKSVQSLFSVESKRLPLPEKRREKEYVIGDSNNGGIERYKTEKHGKGLNRCGLLGFIERETPKYWNKMINNWIENLATNNNDWKNDEVLFLTELTKDYCHSESVTHRKMDDISLFHLWIALN